MMQIKTLVLESEIKNSQSNLNEKIQKEGNALLKELGEAVSDVDVKLDGARAIILVKFDPDKVPSGKKGK